MFKHLFMVLLLAKIVSCQDSCSGRCDDYVDDSYNCQCNAYCETYNDCCQDYFSVCRPSESCSGRCGEDYDYTNTCHCNDLCADYGNCCYDYNSYCDVGSCVGRCESSLDSSQACQCNSACNNYGDCCSDYSTVCNAPSGGDSCVKQSVSSAEILDISLQLFDLDFERAQPGIDVITNEQAMTSDSSTVDVSPDNFFTYVSEELLQRPSYQLLINLLDNYERMQGTNEDVSLQEEEEQDAFLSHFMATDIGKKLYQFLAGKGLAGCSDEDTFKENLKKMWFGLYSRQSNAMDTSGFEHVFVGEIKTDYVSGFHGWVQFHLQEQKRDVNYYGYVTFQQPELYGLHFTWDGYMKGLGGESVGASPEYELAVFTLCHLAKPDSVCQINMRDNMSIEVQRQIQTWTWSKTTPAPGLKYVASAYFIV